MKEWKQEVDKICIECDCVWLLNVYLLYLGPEEAPRNDIAHNFAEWKLGCESSRARGLCLHYWRPQDWNRRRPRSVPTRWVATSQPLKLGLEQEGRPGDICWSPALSVTQWYTAFDASRSCSSRTSAPPSPRLQDVHSVL